MNLLPLIEKRAIRKEYHKRIVVVALVFLASLLSMGLTSVVVSYIVSTYEIAGLKMEIDTLSNSNIKSGMKADIDLVNDTNSKLKILDSVLANDLGYGITDIYTSIIGLSKVKISSLAYDHVAMKKGQVKEVGHRIVVGGVANNRDDLRAFVKSLETDKRFLSVDLPVSSLIESKNIDFLITIMIAKK